MEFIGIYRQTDSRVSYISCDRKILSCFLTNACFQSLKCATSMFAESKLKFNVSGTGWKCDDPFYDISHDVIKSIKFWGFVIQSVPREQYQPWGCCIAKFIRCEHIWLIRFSKGKDENSFWCNKLIFQPMENCTLCSWCQIVWYNFEITPAKYNIPKLIFCPHSKYKRYRPCS